MESIEESFHSLSSGINSSLQIPIKDCSSSRQSQNPGVSSGNNRSNKPQRKVFHSQGSFGNGQAVGQFKGAKLEGSSSSNQKENVKQGTK